MQGNGLPQIPLLPKGIRSAFIDNGNGLDVHYLEAGPADGPCLLLLHGFPELAYSWRKVMAPLAADGFRVIAPDQRGYGRSRGWLPGYAVDLTPYGYLNLVRDALGLLWSLGIEQVSCVVGHDFGSPVAAWCALLRPDVFRSLALMSAPFAGPPEPATQAASRPSFGEALGQLDPPRKHYQWYFSEPAANDDLLGCDQGVHACLRAYLHMKSADWPGNAPAPLPDSSAASFALLPRYYVMLASQRMAETVADEMPDPEQIARCNWLPDVELAFYAAEYSRTGFQGGLNWYRARTTGVDRSQLEVFAGKTISVPVTFIAGRQDWGVHQLPGAFERMMSTACARFTGATLIEGAGHWVQQEQPEATVRHLREFLAEHGRDQATEEQA